MNQELDSAKTSTDQLTFSEFLKEFEVTNVSKKYKIILNVLLMYGIFIYIFLQSRNVHFSNIVDERTANLNNNNNSAFNITTPEMVYAVDSISNNICISIGDGADTLSNDAPFTNLSDSSTNNMLKSPQTDAQSIKAISKTRKIGQIFKLASVRGAKVSLSIRCLFHIE